MSEMLTNAEIDRAARALVHAKGLVWDLIKEDWKSEIRRQAIVALMAARDPNWKEPGHGNGAAGTDDGDDGQAAQQ